MHEDCQVLAEALIAATEAIKASNESIKTSRDRERETAIRLYNINSRLVVAVVVVSLIIVIGVVARDYIQYTSIYDGVNQTQMTITGSNNRIKERSETDGSSTKTPKEPSATKERILDSETN